MAKLLLLDGHSLAYRAFFALPTDLATKSGTVTNAVYGFTSMLAKVVADERPDHLAVAFDAPGGSTYRYELDPDYKAGRKQTPDLFAAQLPLIDEVLEALEIRQLKVPGVEADDVIATLATRAAADGIDVVVVTGDRDSFQLVSDPRIKVLYNKRGVSDYALYDEAGIAERCGGVTPAQYPQYAALRGDTSDNLPGVPGIGEKTAAKLVTTYGSLEGIFEHLADLPPKQRQNLGDAQDRVLKNREMSILDREVAVGVEPKDLELVPFDPERVRTLFNQLEFRTLLPRILDAFGAQVDPATSAVSDTFDVEGAVARDADSALRAMQAANTAPRVGAAARWAGMPGRGQLVALAVATGPDAATYVASDLLAGTDVRREIDALVTRPEPSLVAHRAKELAHGLDIDLRSLAHDSALMAYLLDPGEGKYLLEDLAQRYLSVELTSPDRAEGTLDLDGDADVHDTQRRAALLLPLAEVLEESLRARELLDLYERMERPLVRVLARMEQAGIRIDLDFLNELGRELNDECRRLEGEIHTHAGEQFNVNSTPQLRQILFERLGLTPVKKTKTGPSTDADSLQKLAEEHPIVEALLRYREVEKLRSTYADALPPLVGPDGRIHATFDQLSTTTGRISSVSPNLQNVPVRTAGGRELRRAFIADDGCGLLTADYSQIELRVLAHLADDPGLIDAFERGADVHTTTAARVFDVAEGKVDEFQRRFAKVVNYGLAYGMEAYGLAQRLDIPTDQAREILDAYFAAFPNVAGYMRETIREAKACGYTTTLFGRRRQLPELSSDNFRIRQMGERMAQNAPVQGTAADIFKLAMIDLDRGLETADLTSRMVLTVHDEIVLEVPVNERDRVEPLVRDVMEHAATLRVPLVVDLGFGPNWADAK
ncbi:MAG TPA: DNA polymerase I [Acidimicrobiia bacterium]|nr:DNA polymerase I [Acidimicrobiia bacterium]